MSLLILEKGDRSRAGVPVFCTYKRTGLSKARSLADCVFRRARIISCKAQRVRKLKVDSSRLFFGSKAAVESFPAFSHFAQKFRGFEPRSMVVFQTIADFHRFGRTDHIEPGKGAA